MVPGSGPSGSGLLPARLAALGAADLLYDPAFPSHPTGFGMALKSFWVASSAAFAGAGFPRIRPVLASGIGLHLSDST